MDRAPIPNTPGMVTVTEAGSNPDPFPVEDDFSYVGPRLFVMLGTNPLKGPIRLVRDVGMDPVQWSEQDVNRALFRKVPQSGIARWDSELS